MDNLKRFGFTAHMQNENTVSYRVTYHFGHRSPTVERVELTFGLGYTPAQIAAMVATRIGGNPVIVSVVVL